MRWWVNGRRGICHGKCRQLLQRLTKRGGGSNRAVAKGWWGFFIHSKIKNFLVLTNFLLLPSHTTLKWTVFELDPLNSHYAVIFLRKSLVAESPFYSTRFSVHNIDSVYFLKKWMQCKFNTSDDREMNMSCTRIQLLLILGSSFKGIWGCLKTQDHKGNRSRQSSLSDAYKLFDPERQMYIVPSLDLRDHWKIDPQTPGFLHAQKLFKFLQSAGL